MTEKQNNFDQYLDTKLHAHDVLSGKKSANPSEPAGSEAEKDLQARSEVIQHLSRMVVEAEDKAKLSLQSDPQRAEEYTARSAAFKEAERILSEHWSGEYLSRFREREYGREGSGDTRQR